MDLYMNYTSQSYGAVYEEYRINRCQFKQNAHFHNNIDFIYDNRYLCEPVRTEKCSQKKAGTAAGALR